MVQLESQDRVPVAPGLRHLRRSSEDSGVLWGHRREPALRYSRVGMPNVGHTKHANLGGDYTVTPTLGMAWGYDSDGVGDPVSLESPPLGPLYSPL